MIGLAVPSNGPLAIGGVYQRSALHERFGGNQTAGIVPSPSDPVVLLFHTRESAQQFYGDEFDEEGIYWYSGMGSAGDMEWNYANRAVRDHGDSGRELYLFERVQREGGFWRFAHRMQCVGFREEERRDRDGNTRKAIIFALSPIVESDAVATGATGESLAVLREAALAKETAASSLTSRVENVRLRSGAVRAYALGRANGSCEACKQQAPFVSSTGEPFLEVHHLDRLADGGPDQPDRVAGVCPNCHRRCHYGADGKEFNTVPCVMALEKEARLKL